MVRLQSYIKKMKYKRLNKEIKRALYHGIKPSYHGMIRLYQAMIRWFQGILIRSYMYIFVKDYPLLSCGYPLRKLFIIV